MVRSDKFYALGIFIVFISPQSCSSDLANLFAYRDIVRNCLLAHRHLADEYSLSSSQILLGHFIQ